MDGFTAPVIHFSLAQTYQPLFIQGWETYRHLGKDKLWFFLTMQPTWEKSRVKTYLSIPIQKTNPKGHVPMLLLSFFFRKRRRNGVMKIINSCSFSFISYFISYTEVIFPHPRFPSHSHIYRISAFYWYNPRIAWIIRLVWLNILSAQDPIITMWISTVVVM